MQIIGIKEQIALAKVQTNLREGDFVFVRALKNLGGGKYSVSFAGGRFNVLSEIKLSPGQTFRAQISFSNGKILLTPTFSSASESGLGVISADGASLLASFGLPADGLAARILQFLTQSGAKLDFALMQKARRLAQKFKGRETEAAEAALALEEKGIESDSLALEAVMDLLGGESFGKNSSDENDDEGEGRDASAKIETEQIALELKRYFKFLLESASLKEGEQGKDSVLALFNHVMGTDDSSAKKGWIFLPFEIDGPASKKSSLLGKGGLIRLYLDFEKKAAEKMIINFKSPSGNIYFALYFCDDKKPRAVSVSASDESLEALLSGALDSLKAAFGENVDVNFIPYEKISSFGVQDLPILGVEAFA